MEAPAVLWVNYDAQNMKTLPHRHRVFSHIQNNYRSWERQEKNKALRASVKIPGRLKQPQPQPQPPPSVHQPGPSKDNAVGDNVPRAEQGTDPNDENRRLMLLQEKRQLQTLSPVTVLNKGNSDPFSASAVPITVEENRIVTFYRDILIPATWRLDVKSKDNLANARAKVDWRVCSAGLLDKGTALAFIGSNAALVAMCTGADTSQGRSLVQKSLVYRAKSTAALRQKLAGISKVDHWIWWHIFMIWTAEIAAENVEAAQMHGKMLRKFVDQHFEQGRGLFDKLDEIGLTMIELLFFFLYADLNMSTQLLTPPAFDVYEWLPKAFAPFLRAIEPTLPPAPLDFYPFDPTIDSDEMTACIRLCREICARWRRRWSDGLPANVATMLLGWGQYSWGIALGTLVNRYCRFKQLAETDSGPELDYDYAQQYISISAVKWSRALTFQNDVCGKNIWAGNVLETLRPLLVKSERPRDSPEWHKWKNARLWAFYVGAIYEQRRQQPALSSELFDGWFHEQFARQAHDMGLLTWEDTVDILSGFLFDSSVSQTQGFWFQDTMKLQAESLLAGVSETVN
ncbi:hypothetical protein AYO21_01053 [Fonsecaea monophora]|uniref:Transcription factor domain-containing protein n=1 Tax=Fonsecaea monophora TaxID=254056 RepID=A0A177FJR6_9EURO|nr:hypothetical protein AYO21_01053 [Fonsecaea monophora]KAH0841715.1 hypothetical protein FOPE_06798 [Fonsecaea pedrosoi]OAG44563.1 hypothetical protein AYO21_01053 [Fonsecaea monophora]